MKRFCIVSYAHAIAALHLEALLQRFMRLAVAALYTACIDHCNALPDWSASVLFIYVRDQTFQSFIAKLKSLCSTRHDGAIIFEWWKKDS